MFHKKDGKNSLTFPMGSRINSTDLGSADLSSSLEFKFSVSICGFGDSVFRHFPFVPSFARGE